MDENKKIIYRELQERFVKICWTQKIQEVQASLYFKQNNRQKWYMAIANAITSTSAFVTLVTSSLNSINAQWFLPAITSLIAVISSIITLRFKDGILEDKAFACKQYAAKCRNIRNHYESLMSDTKAGRYTIDELCLQRDKMTEIEDALFLGEIAPHTTSKALKLAKESLIKNKETKTEDYEIEAIVSSHLQEL